MVEFAEGNDGYTISHEWMFWVFEGAFMIVALAVFCIWYPSRYLGNAGTNKAKKSSSEGATNSTTTT